MISYINTTRNNSLNMDEKETIKLLNELIEVKPLESDFSKFVDERFWELTK